MNVLRRLCTLPIRGYQRFLSPLKPRMCRFSPTCSQYAVEAIERHGIVRGALLGSWRILRCNPLCKGGHDPVPASRKERAAARSDHDPAVEARTATFESCASERGAAPPRPGKLHP